MNYKLSSQLTGFHKFGSLALFFYLLGWALIGWTDWLFKLSNNESLSITNLLGFSFLTMFIGVIVFWLCFPLKKVEIENNTLLVSNFIKKIQIPISEISHFEGPDISSLRRIKIFLKIKSEFGDVVIFSPGFLRASNVAAYLKEKLSK